jgi:hypothetical protein
MAQLGLINRNGSITASAATTTTAVTAASTASAVTTAAAAAGATSAASTTSAAVTTTTTAASVFARLGLVDGQASAVVILVVEAVNRGQGLGLGVHLDESESLAPAGVAVLNDLGALDGAELREQLLKLRAVDLIGQITNIQLLAHRWSPGRRKNDPLETFRVEEKGAKGAQAVGSRRGKRLWMTGPKFTACSVVKPSRQSIIKLVLKKIVAIFRFF